MIPTELTVAPGEGGACSLSQRSPAWDFRVEVKGRGILLAAELMGQSGH